jgi:hypothetical protein
MMERKENVRYAAVWLLAVGLISAGCLNREGEALPALVEPADPAPAGTDLQAFLSAPDQVTACEPISIVFSVTNQGESPLYLLTWYTPLEGIAGNIFRVTREGQELDYLGILAMRGDPIPEQYITLEAGESASAQFDISEYYDFSQPGQYQAAYRSPWISFVSGDPEALAFSVDDLGPIKIPSEPVVISVLPGGGNCGQGMNEGDLTEGAAPAFNLSGLVLDASPSAGIILLQEEVGGFSAIALRQDTELVDQDGAPLALTEVQQGMGVEAVGQPGQGGALLAARVVITR